jgi:hypothetical protein
VWALCVSKGKDPMGIVVDIAKQTNRTPMGEGGLVPTLTTNATLYSFAQHRIVSGPALFALQGFKPDDLDFSTLSTPNVFSLLTGNAMSVPVVGSMLAAAVSFADLGPGREHLRAARPPRPYDDQSVVWSSVSPGVRKTICLSRLKAVAKGKAMAKPAVRCISLRPMRRVSQKTCLAKSLMKG